MQGKKQQLEPEREQTGSKLGKEYVNFYAGYIMRNARLDETKAGVKITRRNINSLRYAEDTTLWQKEKRN